METETMNENTRPWAAYRPWEKYPGKRCLPLSAAEGDYQKDSLDLLRAKLASAPYAPRHRAEVPA